MNKQERLDFIQKNRKDIEDKYINRYIELVNEETEIWDYDLFKEVFFNSTYIHNIIILSINYNLRNNEYYVNYYSNNTNLFCFSNKSNKEFDYYKALLREKKINAILND